MRAAVGKQSLRGTRTTATNALRAPSLHPSHSTLHAPRTQALALPKAAGADQHTYKSASANLACVLRGRNGRIEAVPIHTTSILVHDHQPCLQAPHNRPVVAAG